MATEVSFLPDDIPSRINFNAKFKEITDQFQGLGGDAAEIEDWDAATANGWYRCLLTGEGVHAPDTVNQWFGRVDNWDAGILVQNAYYIDRNHMRLHHARRFYDSKTAFSEWEWVSPPMLLKVEYRTTERLGGLAVYRKNVNGNIQYRLEGEEAWRPYTTGSGSLPASRTVEVAADALKGYIESLPRLLTEDLSIVVSGTVTEDIRVEDFYGNGRLTLRGTAKEECSFINASLTFENCRCLVTARDFAMQSDGTAAYTAMLMANHCFYVDASNIAITDLSASKRGVSVGAGCVQLGSVSISGCAVALLLANSALVSVYAASSAAAPVYSDNTVGISTYRGGVVHLAGVPELLGGASNANNAGLITKGGKVL